MKPSKEIKVLIFEPIHQIQTGLINALIKNGYKPVIQEIEKCNKDNWEKREIYWIKHYRKLYDLTNILDGGEGGATYGRLGIPWTDEQRINNRKARLGMPVNHTKEGNKKRQEGIRRYFDSSKVPVFQYSFDGKFLRKWNSAVDAGEKLNIIYSNITI